MRSLAVLTGSLARGSCAVVSAAVLAAPAVLAGCRGTVEPVRIGVAFPARNAPAAFIAADEINAGGGIHGRPLVIVLDTIPTAAEPADLEIRRAESIVAVPGVVAVIGHGGSRGSLAAAPVYNRSRVVHVVPTGTSRLLAKAGPWTLPLPPNDSVEGAVIARYVRDVLRARTAAVFYVNDEYGVGLRDGVLAALAGGPVRVVRQQRFDVLSDMATLSDALVREGAPEALIMAGRTAQTAAVARRLSERGARTRIVAGDGAMNLPDLADASGPGGQGMLVATFWLPGRPDSASVRFNRAVQYRLFREATATDALIYDAMKLLAAAIAEVGDRPEAVRRYLLSLGRGRPRYQGVSGEIGFGEGAGPPRVVMATIRGRVAVAAPEAP